ncbi:TetR/AcrR family transcriptional regulator [Ideonella sp. B508-1]|uniref:TetR/AcrR family transcriptional regulator n=1 Tax=Ideonella sp. B508-1 TaxID=137716 RepID=UPI00034A6DA4|nr:TetR/AcrR family transcriptional regulator [Ideonella sp. B508-1]
MVAKPPRRTPQRILEAARALYNRFGEPNISTTRIAAELCISPGNLHYHYPTKNALLDALVAEDLQALDGVLAQAPAVRRTAEAWQCIQAQLALAHKHRFLLRDLNELLSRNRQLEQQVQAMLLRQTEAARALLAGLVAGGDARMSAAEIDDLATALVLVLNGWHSFAFARAPRLALEAPQAERTLAEGVGQVLALVAPYLTPQARDTLRQLRQPMSETPVDPTPFSVAAPTNVGSERCGTG